MLVETDITVGGCRVWLDGDNKRQVERAVRKLEHFAFSLLCDPIPLNYVGPRKVKKERKTSARTNSGTNPGSSSVDVTVG